jgi:hypothetical protein
VQDGRKFGYFASVIDFILQNLLTPILTLLFVKYCIKPDIQKEVPVKEKTPSALMH